MSQRPENFFHTVLAMREAQRQVEYARRTDGPIAYWQRQARRLEKEVDRRLEELEGARSIVNSVKKPKRKRDDRD